MYNQKNQVLAKDDIKGKVGSVQRDPQSNLILEVDSQFGADDALSCPLCISGVVCGKHFFTSQNNKSAQNA